MHQKYTGNIGEALTLISRKHDSKNKVHLLWPVPLQIDLKNFSRRNINDLRFVLIGYL